MTRLVVLGLSVLALGVAAASAARLPQAPALRGLPGLEPVEPARRQAAGRAQLDRRSSLRSATATTSTPTSAPGSGRAGRSGSRSRSSAARRRSRASQFEYAYESDKGPYPIPANVAIEGGRGCGRRPACADRRPRPLQALRALRALPDRGRRLAGRLGRDLRPALEQAPPRRLDVRRRRRAADPAGPRALRGRGEGADRPRAPLHRPRHTPLLRLAGASLRERQDATPTCRRWVCASA